MSSAKFTPGPWEYNERLCAISGNEGWKIAHIFDYGGNGESDAQLIAAAPEMYEALESLLRWFSFKRPLRSDLWKISYSFIDAEGVNKALEDARKVLIKAQGGGS